MKLSSIITSATITLSILCQGITAKNTEILTIDDFNDIINSHNLQDPHATSFNIIKYYTTWCSHCKRLQPIWSQLVSEFPNVNFLSIDCDIFAKDLCQGLPGYPIIKVITTGENDLITIDDNGDGNLITNTIMDGWLQYIKSWFKRGDKQKLIHIEPERILPYKGARNYEQLSNFINHLLELDQLQSNFIKIVYENDVTLDTQLLSSFYNEYLLSKGVIILNEDKKIEIPDMPSLERERNKLENMIRNSSNNKDDQPVLKTKLQFINWIEDQIGNTETDSNQFKDEL